MIERISPRAADEYVARVVVDPEMFADYERAAEEEGEDDVHDIIRRDALTPPCITRVDFSRYHGKAGDTIAVWADDDFFLAGVNVAISTLHDDLIESGCPNPPEDRHEPWVYHATTTLPPHQIVAIDILVADAPCNMTNRLELFRRTPGAL